MTRPKNNPGLPFWRGDALRLHRVHAGWSAAQLARRIGVEPSTVTRWERGVHAPDADRVAELATILGIPRASFAREPRIV